MGQPPDDKQLGVSTWTVVSPVNVHPPSLRNLPSTSHLGKDLLVQTAQLAFSLVRPRLIELIQRDPR
eukprot:5454493-Pyramimonas_sp.AAC.1